MTRRDDRCDAALAEPALQRIRAETKVYTAPPEGFDPVNAAKGVLAEYGLPPKPDGEKQRAFWHRLLSPPKGRPLTFKRQRADGEPIIDPFSDCALSLPRRIRARSRYEQSQNWSGAYVTPKGGHGFTSVHGIWTVPQLEPPPASRRAEEQPLSSIWVGLDGQREYLDSSLPQVGTMQFLDSSGRQVTVAWWQWWARDQHNPPTRLDLDVAPGETIMAQVEVLDSHHARFIIKNDDTGQIIAPIVARAPLVSTTGSARFAISGATAEWVMERPTRWGTEEHYELSNYGRLRFSECLAVSDAFEQDLTGAKLINMFAVREKPHRKDPVSFTEIRGDRSFETVYQDFAASLIVA